MSKPTYGLREEGGKTQSNKGRLWAREELLVTGLVYLKSIPRGCCCNSLWNPSKNGVLVVAFQNEPVQFLFSSSQGAQCGSWRKEGMTNSFSSSAPINVTQLKQ